MAELLSCRLLAFPLVYYSFYIGILWAPEVRDGCPGSDLERSTAIISHPVLHSEHMGGQYHYTQNRYFTFSAYDVFQIGGGKWYLSRKVGCFY